jgi:hypothetical protein
MRGIMGFITSLSKHSLSKISGKVNEYPLSLFLRNLDKSDYSILKDYNLDCNGNSSVIDYIIVSKYGIFVINSKNLPGTIAHKDGKWIQKINGSENLIENPVLETYNLVNLLKKEVLTVKDIEIIPIIIFNATSKLDFNLDGIINSPEIIRKIKSYSIVISNPTTGCSSSKFKITSGCISPKNPTSFPLLSIFAHLPGMNAGCS